MKAIRKILDYPLSHEDMEVARKLWKCLQYAFWTLLAIMLGFVAYSIALGFQLWSLGR